MKILVIGATGTIGKNVVKVLQENDHSVISAGHKNGDVTVDLASKKSIEAMFEHLEPVDAVISTAGVANFAPFNNLSDEDFALALSNKLMGQVNLVRIGKSYMTKGGSIILTSGVLSREPIPGSVAISMVNGALESFVKAVALELGSSLQIKVVSPLFVKETMEMMGMDSTHGVSVLETAKVYLTAVERDGTGEILEVRDYL